MRVLQKHTMTPRDMRQKGIRRPLGVVIELFKAKRAGAQEPHDIVTLSNYGFKWPTMNEGGTAVRLR